MSYKVNDTNIINESRTNQRQIVDGSMFGESSKHKKRDFSFSTKNK